MILREVPNCRQVPGEPRRRWFCSTAMDVIVWYGGEEIVGVQLMYRDQDVQRALTWHRDKGCRHELVDDGELMGRAKMTPVMSGRVPFPRELVESMFRVQSQGLPVDVRLAVELAIAKYDEESTGGVN